MLRIAVPNKGSLSEPAITMLTEAGYRTRRTGRELVLLDEANGVELFFLRPQTSPSTWARAPSTPASPAVICSSIPAWRPSSTCPGLRPFNFPFRRSGGHDVRPWLMWRVVVWPRPTTCSCRD